MEILRLAIIDLTNSEMDYEMFEKKYMVKSEVPQEIVDFYCTVFEEMSKQFYNKKASNQFTIVPYRNLNSEEKSALQLEEHRKKDVYVIQCNGESITPVLFNKDKIQHIFILDKGGRKYFI